MCIWRSRGGGGHCGRYYAALCGFMRHCAAYLIRAWPRYCKHNRLYPQLPSSVITFFVPLKAFNYTSDHIIFTQNGSITSIEKKHTLHILRGKFAITCSAVRSRSLYTVHRTLARSSVCYKQPWMNIHFPFCVLLFTPTRSA